MNGILIKGLVLVAVMAGTVAAQPPTTLDTMRFFDQNWTQLYGSSLNVFFPLSRDFNGGGVRARGMGNAFLGVSDDVSAVTWNPAGLYRQDRPYEQPVISLAYQSLSSDAAYTSKPYDNLEAGRFDMHDVANGVNFMSIVLPLRIKGHLFVGSIAYSRAGDEFSNAGMVIDTSYFFTDQDILDNITRPYHYRNESIYRSWANALNFGFGTRLHGNWSVGLAINVMAGGAAQFRQETMIWEDILVPGLPGRQRGLGVSVNNVYDTTSYSGVNFVLGVRYVAGRLSGGLVVKTPYTLKESIDVLVDTRGSVNGVEVSGASVIRHIDDNILELDQPMIIGAGMGFKATENLLFAADVEYRPYGGGAVNRRDSLLLVPGGTDIEYFTSFDPYWNNTWAIRLGTEYIWQTGSILFPTVPLRAGFGYVQQPTPNVDGVTDGVVDDILDIVPITSKTSTTKWSLGAGVRWAQIDLDLAYEKSSGDWEDGFFRQQASSDNSSLSFMFTGYF